MSYTDAEASAATAAMDKYRAGQEGEVGAALIVVGRSAERAAKESRIRDDMIRVAHRAGASIRQLAEVSGPSMDSTSAWAAPPEGSEGRRWSVPRDAG